MWKKKKQKEQFSFNTEKVFLAATQPLGSVFSYFQTSRIGLTPEEVEKRLSHYGKNEIEHEQKKNPFSTFIKVQMTYQLRENVLTLIHCSLLNWTAKIQIQNC